MQTISTALPPAPTQSPERRGRGARARRELANAAREILLSNPGAPHHLRDVAATLRVSPFHLAHTFREETGVSMHKYLLRVRLDMARVRILAGEPNLSRLALELGFSSHSHFTTMFREHFKVSPASIRERCGREYAMASSIA
jgi:AraC family transcriptional regulator